MLSAWKVFNIRLLLTKIEGLAMSSNQGVKRLYKGIVRSLYPHEIIRGYIFISKDKLLPMILDTNDFKVTIRNQVYFSRRIDVSGRVHIPRLLLRTIGTQQLLRIMLISRKEISIEPLEI